MCIVYFPDTYAYSSANQRIQTTLADGSHWVYDYDSLGQVKSGKKFWADWTPVAGQQFEYAFDDIGNRTATKAGGDEHGASLRPANYSANNLNQYTSRDVPGAVDIMGISFATNTVTVNGQATYRKGEYFRKELPIDNANNPVWTNVTVAATGQTSVTGHEFLPKTQEQFSYDDDGNLTDDGRWVYTWDAENRLIQLTARTNLAAPQLIKFEYDSKSRRIHKQVWNNTSFIGTPALDTAFVYDGWNLIASLSPNFQLLSSYTWGLDLSGSLQGAGGIGGLLFIGDFASAIGYYTPAYDGNGNVMALANATSGTNSATYEYGPFGEVIRATGPMAKTNPFRFSTKYQDDETDLLYYGYRYYGSAGGRWQSRDPVEERGGLHPYAILKNDCLYDVDLYGLLSPRVKVEGSYVRALGRFLNRKTVEPTGFLNALARAHNLLPYITVDEDAIGNARALYYPAQRRLVVDKHVNVIGPRTLAHEFTHVYNDIVLNLSRAEEVDEGMGYAMGSFADVAELLWQVEAVAQKGDCSAVWSAGAQRWQQLWKQYGVIPSKQWGPVVWDDDRSRRDLDVNDLRLLGSFHGVHLGCRAAAAALNDIVGSYGCCVMFVCTPQGEAGEIGTGIQINEFFK